MNFNNNIADVVSEPLMTVSTPMRNIFEIKSFQLIWLMDLTITLGLIIEVVARFVRFNLSTDSAILPTVKYFVLIFPFKLCAAFDFFMASKQKKNNCFA